MAFSDVILMHKKSDQELYRLPNAVLWVSQGTPKVLYMNLRLTLNSSDKFEYDKTSQYST